MKKLIIGSLALFAGMYSGLNAQSLTEKIPMNDKVITGTLSNGLRYYIQQNKKPENKLELRLAVNAGAVLEDNDQQGLAHFMEHMNFNGLKNFPANELVHYLQSIGVEFGADLNAYTGFDETVYILPVPSDDKEKLEKAFTIISDWSGNALMEGEEIDKERGVVLEESRGGKGPDDRMMQKWLPKLFNGSIYGKRLPIGKDEILKNFKYDVIRRFHKDWYRPNLEAVCVVGDIDPQEALRLIKKNFDGFKNPANPRVRPATFAFPARLKSETMVLSDPESPYTSIMLTGNPAASKADKTGADYRSSIIKNLFNYMMNQRFEEYKSKPEPPFLFASAGFEDAWARGYEYFAINTYCSEKGINNAIKTAVGECMRVKKFGYNSAELERAKAAILGIYEKQYNERNKTESSRLVMEYVGNFLSGEPVPGIEWEYAFMNKYLSGISLAEVNALGKKIDIDKKYFCAVTTKTQPNLPTNAEVNTVIANAIKTPIANYVETAIAKNLLSKEPIPGKITKTETNAKLGTTTFTLSNGAKVTVKPTTLKDDEILLNGYRSGGSSVYEGADYQSADYANNVVDEMGYGAFSNVDLGKFLSGKQVRFNNIIEMYKESVQGSSTKKDLKTFFELLYLSSTSPRVDQTSFQSFITRSKQELENARLNPDAAFADSMSYIMNQKNPRSRELPTADDYDKISLNNAVQFYKDRFSNASGMEYFIVGSVSLEELKPMLEKYIGSLTGNGVVSNKFKDLNITPALGNNSFTLNMGSEPKSMIGHRIYKDIEFSADDNFTLAQLNEIINNKITDKLREEMGVIYSGGMGGGITKYPVSRFMAQTFLPCGPENVEAADKAFWDIITSVTQPGGITEADWTKAKNTTIEKNKKRLQTNGFWINSLNQASYNGLDPERILTLNDRIEKINLTILMDIAKKYYTNMNVYKGFLMPSK
jgi:zinc protease